VGAGVSMPAVERRDVVARGARDRLAAALGVHPKRLATIDAELAGLLAFRLEQAEEAAQLASQDELTGALSRAAGRRILEREIHRTERSGDALSVVFVDVDGLKSVNDEHGHAIGDKLLARLGETFTDTLRPYDVLIRWGGDEFVLVLPDCDWERAETVARRLCQEFTAATGYTLTCGTAQRHQGDDLPALVERADTAMYAAKRARRGSSDSWS
jgi:diguanylate cyclase (GGDEF)-like protein